jgi:hypothetical protein
MAKSNSEVAVRRREHWQELLRRWQASGLSQAQSCQRRGIPIWRFTWWKRRLGAEGVDRGSSFVPVQVAAPPPAGELELTLRGGRVLRFGADVEAARLAGIVAALEAIPC